MSITWPPPRRRVRLRVALPTNVLSEAPSLREKTIKIGIIGRALAIFRVDEVVFYRRRPDEGKLIRDLMKYHFTPPYLKKYIPLRTELRYAGLLPPLKAPAHTTPVDVEGALRYGYREGIVLVKRGSSAILDIGMRYRALLPNARDRRRGDHVLVRILGLKGRYLLSRLVKEEQVPFYWRPHIGRTYNSLKGLIKSEYEKGLLVGTSKWGTPISKAMERMVKRAIGRGEMLLIFGAPDEGLYEMAKDEGFALEDVIPYVVNFIPQQGVETVRTEEALFATLAILNELIP